MSNHSPSKDANSHYETACCKAGRVATNYGFRQYLDEVLSSDWAAMDGPSLREISKLFNKRIIQETLIDQGEPPLEGEEDLIYEHLTQNSEKSLDRIERRLEKTGIDAISLREDFVSYKTIDRHFKNCVELERETKEPLSKSEAVDRIRAMNRRIEKVAENTLTEISNHTSTNFESQDVSSTVMVTCTECGERKSFAQAVREGCECNSDSEHARGSQASDEDPNATFQIEDS